MEISEISRIDIVISGQCTQIYFVRQIIIINLVFLQFKKLSFFCKIIHFNNTFLIELPNEEKY